MRAPRTVVINGAFRGQRVTGQQRYAGEIADRLARRPGFVEYRPPTWLSGRLANWLWVQTLSLRHPHSVILSLTARTPLFGRRGVTVVHDLFPLTNPEWYGRTYAAVHRAVLAWNLRRSAGLVTVSPMVRQQLRGRTSSPISVAPNAPSDAFTTSAPPGPHASGVRMLAVGSHDPRKNHALLAEAFRIYRDAVDPEARLTVVGGAAPGVFGDAAVAWPEGTELLGYVDDATLAGLYRDADVVAFPSLAEGFGLPLVEALAAGGNLAVSDLPVFRWICGDAARYFRTDDPIGAAEALAEAVSHPRRLTAEARAELNRRFNWDHSAAVVAEVCRELGAR